MVTMEMTKHDIRCGFQGLKNILPDFYTGCHLARVGKQAVPPISQGDAGINENSLFPGSYHTAHAANSQGFRTNYFNGHRLFLFQAISGKIHAVKSEFLVCKAEPYAFPGRAWERGQKLIAKNFETRMHLHKNYHKFGSMFKDFFPFLCVNVIYFQEAV